MSLKTFGRAIAAAVLFALSAAPLHAEWLEAKSPHFTVIGNMSEGEARERTLELERYAAMLRFVFAVKDTVPVTVWVVPGLGEVQEAVGGRMRNVAGFYKADAQAANAVVPEHTDLEGFTPRVVLFHEYAHHVLLSNVAVFMPGWAQEGLAEMFDTAKVNSDGSVMVGAKNDARGEQILSNQRWSVERMLQSDFHPPADAEEALEKYSRGWTLIHYLWLSGKRAGQYAAFISDLNRSLDPVASGKKVFGDLRKLDSELDTYVRMHAFNTSRFSAQQLGAPSEVRVRPLTAGEAAMINYRLVSTLGVDQTQARRLVERAAPVAARFPNSLPVQTWLAEMEHDAGDYDASAAAADRSLAIDPNSLFAMVYKGRALMRKAVAAHDASLAQQARGWFLRANKVDANHALSFELYYDSFLAMGQAAPEDAVTGLYRAVELVPQDDELRIRAALALIREGKLGPARLVLAPAAFVAEGNGENAALKLIKEMDGSKQGPALLAKAAELKLDRINDFVDPPKDADKR